MKRLTIRLLSTIAGAVLIARLLVPAVAEAAAWTVVSSPTVSGGSELHAVTAISTNDVWAVGESFGAGSPSQTLIEQWNGRKWSVVSSPNIGTQNNELSGVTAVSATDIWAVGFFQATSGGPQQTLTLHWDG